MISSYQANPSQGHKDQISHICVFLMNKPNLILYLDTVEPPINHSIFNSYIEPFREHFHDEHEEFPHRIPDPRDISVVTTCYIYN